MDHLKTLFVTALVPLVFAACTLPAPQRTASPAPPTSVAGQQAALLPRVTVKTVTDATRGRILIDANRMTLYRYANDAPNVSNCYDQ